MNGINESIDEGFVKRMNLDGRDGGRFLFICVCVVLGIKRFFDQVAMDENDNENKKKNRCS